MYTYSRYLRESTLSSPKFVYLGPVTCNSNDIDHIHEMRIVEKTTKAETNLEYGYEALEYVRRTEIQKKKRPKKPKTPLP